MNTQTKQKLVSKLTQALHEAGLKSRHEILTNTRGSFEGKTSQGHSVGVFIHDGKIDYSWTDRAGSKEGWERKTFSLNAHGTTAVIARVKQAMRW